MCSTIQTTIFFIFPLVVLGSILGRLLVILLLTFAEILSLILG